MAYALKIFDISTLAMEGKKFGQIMKNLKVVKKGIKQNQGDCIHLLYEEIKQL